MGLRFYRRIKLFPGVRLNISRSGVSTSVGVRGAHVTIGHGETRETIGLPGSGLSYTHVEGARKSHGDGAQQAQLPPVAEPLPRGRAWRGWLWIALFVSLVSITATYAWQL
jgi:hypothetical protein